MLSDSFLQSIDKSKRYIVSCLATTIQQVRVDCSSVAIFWALLDCVFAEVQKLHYWLSVIAMINC